MADVDLNHVVSLTYCLASRLFISPLVPDSRLVRSDTYQGAAVTFDLLPLLGFTADGNLILHKSTQAKMVELLCLRELSFSLFISLTLQGEIYKQT